MLFLAKIFDNFYNFLIFFLKKKQIPDKNYFIQL